MIRPADVFNPTAALLPTTLPAARAGARDASAWFADGSTAGARITGDLNPAARGLSVAQHASLVLAHLRGEG